MAIDSAAKRRSIVGISYHYYCPGVTPDGTPGVEWRQQSGHSYSGNAPAETITPDAPSGGIHMGMRLGL